MHILIDQNISYRLLELIKPLFLNVQHVKDIGLWNKNDYEIFMESRMLGINAIITLDADFVMLYQQFGTPPKVIWIRTGNISTESLAALLLRHHQTVYDFVQQDTQQCLQIFR